MMKTTIWTAWDTTRPSSSLYGDDSGQPRCIWRGELTHLFRAGDMVQVLEGYCVETVAHVYYGIPDNSQEIHLTTSDPAREYPTVAAP
jgi:hypothetical protein